MHYQIYVDEAGNTPYYNDVTQPVSAWGGVITNKSEEDFDKEVRFLLKEFGLSEDTEFHAYEIFRDKGPFEFLSNENRELILLKFLSVGIQYIDYYHACDDLNCFKKPEDRLKFESRNLSILERLLFLFVTQVDFYLHFKLGATYSLCFDKSGDFCKNKKLILELQEFSESHYYLRGIQDEPNKLDSKHNRFIQFADIICDIRKKLTALETKTFTGGNKFIEHEAFIKNCYQIIKSKEMPFVKFFAANLDFFKSGNDQKVIEFNKMCDDWVTRDFSNISGLQAKKKKPDIFKHSVNTFWEERNEEFNLMKIQIDRIIEGKHLSLDEGNAEILLEIFFQFYELLIGKFKRHSFLPEFEELKNRTEELIRKTIDTNNLFLNETSAAAVQKAIDVFRRFNLIPQDEEAVICSFNENLNELLLNLAPYVCELKSFDNKLNEILRKSVSEINPENKMPREIYYVKEPATLKRIIDFIRDYNEYIRTICEKLTVIYNDGLHYFQILPNEIESELTFQKVYIEKVINSIKEAIGIIFRKLRQFHGVINGFKITNIEISRVINAGRENNLKISELFNEINDIMDKVKISRKFLNF